MGTIKFNGITYQGSSITISNNKVLIDGVEQHKEAGHTLKIIVEGDIKKLDCHEAVINGDVLGDVDAHNVECQAINGNVDAHNVRAVVIGGDVDAFKVKKVKESL